MQKIVQVLLFTTTCLGAVYQNIEDLPTFNYDFVIIGGGTAGSVLAERLTEEINFHVLVIESGPSNEGAVNTTIPAFATLLEGTIFDWNFTTTNQPGLNGRELSYPRGHNLGGSSSINGMFYTRGSSDDWDRFASETQDGSRAWNKILPFILKNEKFVPPADNHNPAGQFDPSFHNFAGTTSVSLPGFPRTIDAMVLQTTKDLPNEFPFNLDMNSGTPIGLGWLQSTVGNGMRSSAATSYLDQGAINRPNLHILLDTRVTRVLKTSTTGRVPEFRTVEIATNANGPRTLVSASKEVILSAGSIGTPHILQLSGIGDPSDLSKLGIPLTVNLPSVGKNLSDQPLLTASWFANSTDPLSNIFVNATLLTELLQEWEKTHTGPLVNGGPSQVAWLRLPQNASIFQRFSDPSAGPHSPHLELTFSTGGGFNLPGMQSGDNFVGIGAAVVTPTSRGFVKLRSNNPFDPPLINPALLDTDFDIFAMRETLSAAKRFFAGPAWKGFVLAPAGALANATTDQLLDDFIRDTAFSASHPVGTAAMSAKDANFGVVNPDLLVKGVSGLRIVDASVMPFITCGHTQAPTYAIAERGADLIKSLWN